MSSSVQFKGIDNVLSAFENRNVPAWSLWQGRQFLFKHEGNDLKESADSLHQILDQLNESTNAIYTLKVYEDWNGGRIKNNTPDDGSFNFKLNAEGQEITLSQYGKVNGMGAISERLAAIEERLTDKEEEEPKSKFGMIGDILNDEALGPIVAPILTGLLQKILTPVKRTESGQATTQQPTQNDFMRPAAIAGIEEYEQTLSEAIAILRKADPKLPEHLTKLAKMSQEDPGSFQQLLSIMETM